MSTLYCVTTGISLYTSRCWAEKDGGSTPFEPPTKGLWEQLVEEGSDAVAFLERINAAVAHVTGALGGDEAEFLQKAREIVEKRFDLACWKNSSTLRLLPAEMATLCAMQNSLAVGDRILFLYGHTKSRKSAALQVACLDRVLLKGISVRLAARPIDWEPSGSESFHQGMEGLFAQVLDEQDGRSLALVLTGGYKAVLIEVAHWISAGARNANALYLHEDQSQIVQINFKDGHPTGYDFRPVQ